jgi:MFS family permease
VLVIARFLGGLAFASLGIAPMYIGEIAPREKRGMLVTVSQLNIVLGFSLAYFANYFVLKISQSDLAWVQTLGMDQHAWRWMLGIEAVPAALWFIFLFTIPESPRWLVMKSRFDEARRVLVRLKPPERLQADLEALPSPSRSPGSTPYISMRRPSSSRAVSAPTPHSPRQR